MVVEDHLSAMNPLLKSLYLFHVYYHFRRIFVEIKAPIPKDNTGANIGNEYDKKAYERICREFGVSPYID